MSDTYISVSIETDGPLPGLNSILSIGAAAFHTGRLPFSTLEINLSPMSGSSADPATLLWWAQQNPSLWEKVTTNPITPESALSQFGTWLSRLKGTIVLVVQQSHTFMWIYYYWRRFIGHFPYTVMDLRSLSFGLLLEHSSIESVTGVLPSATHKPLIDAISQGECLMDMLSYREPVQ